MYIYAGKRRVGKKDCFSEPGLVKAGAANLFEDGL